MIINPTYFMQEQMFADKMIKLCIFYSTSAVANSRLRNVWQHQSTEYMVTSE